MSSLKNPTLRKRTRELSECAEDARECQLLGYELKDLGSLLVKMAIHMEDLQRKVDSQAEYIKTLNEDRKTESDSENPNNCEDCRHNKLEWFSEVCDGCSKANSNYEQKAEPQTEYPCNTCANKGDHDGECSNCITSSETIRWKTPSHYKLTDEPQTDNSIGCSRCKGRHDCPDRDMPHAVHCNNYGKVTDEPQTERSEQ